MKRRGRWWLIVVVLVVGAIYLWRRDPPQALREADPALLFDRLWVDSKPKRDTDYVQALVVLTRLPIGLFQKASSYRFEAERFDYRRKDRRLALRFPQRDEHATLAYRVRPCDELPPYDLCLDLKSKNPWGGPRRYYGMRQRQRASDARRLQRALDALQVR